MLVEAEIHAEGRDRVQVNRQPLRRARDLLGALQITVFAPDDLALIKAGPQWRRDYLDDLLVARHPRHDATITEVDRVIRQRNALLKSVLTGPGGRSVRSDGDLPEDVRVTLEVWDTKLAAAGQDLVRARAGLVEALGPLVGESYRRLAASSGRRPLDQVTRSLAYRQSWAGASLVALAAASRRPTSAGASPRWDRTETTWT